MYLNLTIKGEKRWRTKHETCGELRERPTFDGENLRLQAWKLHVAVPTLLEWDACAIPSHARLMLVEGCVGEPTFDGPMLTAQSKRGECPIPHKFGFHASIILQPGLYTAALAVPAWVPCMDFYMRTRATLAAPEVARAEMRSAAMAPGAYSAPLGMLSLAVVLLLVVVALALTLRARRQRGAADELLSGNQPTSEAVVH